MAEDNGLEFKLKKVMASVLDLPMEQVTESLSPESVDAWDSLKQMTLILTLEEEFGIHFSDEQVVELLSYKLIRETLREITRS